MQQWNKELMDFHAEKWIEAMNTTDNFCAEIRSKEDVDKHSDADVKNFNVCMGSSTDRVEKALCCIKSRGYLGQEMSALDIGSGNGIYTIPFSQYYKNVFSLDISPSMQAEIQRKARELNISNISYLNANWCDLDVENTGMEDNFDLVLCSINPRGVCNYETLNKMNVVSRGGCCLSAFAGRGTSNHGTDLQKLILGRTLGTTGGNNIIFPFNVIYHMGGEPELTYSSVKWERRQNPEEAIETICYSYWRFADITDSVKKTVAAYVYSNLEDGLYVDRVENRIGIMVWDAWRIKGRRRT